jgi:hypothetical protein
MCQNTEHFFTSPGNTVLLGTICDCGKFYWEDDQAQPIGRPDPCMDCYALPKAIGADWCMDCPELVAWTAKEEALCK